MIVEALSPVFPDKMILGVEIRAPAVESVQQRLSELCGKSSSFGNCGVVQMNAMKHLPNYFVKGQLKVMFFLFGDPHFKKSKQKNRIISVDLLDVYAYVLSVGGKLYTATDVEDLHLWEVGALESHPLFERVSEKDCESDPIVPLILSSTYDAEKGKKEGRGQWYSCWRRIAANKK